MSAYVKILKHNSGASTGDGDTFLDELYSRDFGSQE